MSIETASQSLASAPSLGPRPSGLFEGRGPGAGPSIAAKIMSSPSFGEKSSLPDSGGSFIKSAQSIFSMPEAPPVGSLSFDYRVSDSRFQDAQVLWKAPYQKSEADFPLSPNKMPLSAEDILKLPKVTEVGNISSDSVVDGESILFDIRQSAMRAKTESGAKTKAETADVADPPKANGKALEKLFPGFIPLEPSFPFPDRKAGPDFKIGKPQTLVQTDKRIKDEEKKELEFRQNFAYSQRTAEADILIGKYRETFEKEKEFTAPAPDAFVPEEIPVSGDNVKAGKGRFPPAIKFETQNDPVKYAEAMADVHQAVKVLEIAKDTYPGEAAEDLVLTSLHETLKKKGLTGALIERHAQPEFATEAPREETAIFPEPEINQPVNVGAQSPSLPREFTVGNYFEVPLPEIYGSTQLNIKRGASVQTKPVYARVVLPEKDEETNQETKEQEAQFQAAAGSEKQAIPEPQEKEEEDDEQKEEEQRKTQLPRKKRTWVYQVDAKANSNRKKEALKAFREIYNNRKEADTPPFATGKEIVALLPKDPQPLHIQSQIVKNPLKRDGSYSRLLEAIATRIPAVASEVELEERVQYEIDQLPAVEADEQLKTSSVTQEDVNTVENQDPPKVTSLRQKKTRRIDD